MIPLQAFTLIGEVLGFRKVVITKRSKCSYEGGYLCVYQDDGCTRIHLNEIDCLMLESQSVMISVHLLSELAKSKIATLICDNKHLPISSCVPFYGSHNTSEKLREQISWSAPSKKRVWQKVVQNKIEKQSQVLDMLKRPNGNRLLEMSKSIQSGDSQNGEGAAARIYFTSLFGAGFARDGGGAINSALNYGYQVLLAYVCREVTARGYLSQLGIHHRSVYNQYNFASDLMEPFRPIVDLFVATDYPKELSAKYKHTIVSLFDEKVKYDGGSYRVSSVISFYIDDCLRALNKNIDYRDIRTYYFE